MSSRHPRANLSRLLLAPVWCATPAGASLLPHRRADWAICTLPQGASWSTPRRGFHFHDTDPSPATAHIKPADAPRLLSMVPPPSGGGGASAGEEDGGSGGGGTEQSFAVYLDSTEASAGNNHMCNFCAFCSVRGAASQIEHAMDFEKQCFAHPLQPPSCNHAFPPSHSPCAAGAGSAGAPGWGDAAAGRGRRQRHRHPGAHPRKPQRQRRWRRQRGEGVCRGCVLCPNRPRQHAECRGCSHQVGGMREG